MRFFVYVFSALYYSLRFVGLSEETNTLNGKTEARRLFFSLKKRFFVETQNFRVFLKICVMACLVW